jgi:hypothetical protein
MSAVAIALGPDARDPDRPGVWRSAGTSGPQRGGLLAMPTASEARHKEADMPEDTEDTPVLDTLAAMTAVSIEQCELEPRELMLARFAALAAVDAPPVSYLLNAGAASDVGVTLEDVQGTLIAIAPVVGTAKIMSAAGNITRALGFAIAVAEAELEDEAG